MQRLISIFAFAFLCSETAQGRIGDTEAEVRTHYGNALTVLPSRAGDPGLTKCYSYQAYLVAVTYVHGRSVREILTKADNSKISGGEIHTVLDANAGSSTWDAQQLRGPEKVTTGVQQWRTSDRGPRVAFYDLQTRALFVTTQQFIDLTKAAKRQNTRLSDTRELAGPTGRPQRSINVIDRSTVSALRGGQPQPSASPASK